MKKLFIFTNLLLLIILTAGLAHSEVNWLNEEANDYVFSLNLNRGEFYYFPNGRIYPNDASVSMEQSDPYNFVAEGQFTEFGDNFDGEIRMHAMAMGPDQNDKGEPVNPTNGLKVQAFAQVAPNSLDMRHGIFTDQDITSWSTRKFTVEQPDSYELKAELEGDLLFNAFHSSADYYANKELIAKVILSAYVTSDTGDIVSTDLINSLVTLNNPISTTLTLNPTDNVGRQIFYELMISINLASEISNINWAQSSIVGPIDGFFNLGTPDKPIALTATVARYYDLTTSVDGDGGSISPENGRRMENEIVVLTAEPEPGYRVASWHGTDDDNSTGKTNTITMAGNRTVSVSFEVMPPNTYELLTTVTPENAGTIKISPDLDRYAEDTEVTLTATANIGYRFDQWEGAITGQNTPITVRMDQDHHIFAWFVETPDYDADGVDDLLEQGPDTDNPNPEYDGNNDGIADHLQSHVVSMPTHDNQHYVTLEFVPGSHHTEVTCVAPNAEAPSDFELPYGCFNFKIDGIEPGGSTKVKIILHDDNVPEAYLKFGSTTDNTTPHWYDFSNDGTTGASIDGNTITLSFVDDNRGDDDLRDGSIIVDQGGPAIKAASSNLTIEEPQSKSTSSHGCFITSADKQSPKESLNYLSTFLLNLRRSLTTGAQ